MTFRWACYSSAVGYGNLLWFPLLCEKHGGLWIFIIPYFCLLLLASIPILILQLGLGQKFQNGNIWPSLDIKLAGIGLAQAYMSIVNTSTYIVIVSWSLIYFIQSFGERPWVD